MGSADIMQRNLDHRVEVLVAIADPDVSERLYQSLALELEPNRQTWELDADGSWVRDARSELLDLHRRFEEDALERRRAPHPAKSA